MKKKTYFERKRKETRKEKLWDFFYEQKGAAVIAVMIISAIILSLTAPAIGYTILGTAGFCIGAFTVFLLTNVAAARIRQKRYEKTGRIDRSRAELINTEVICLLITAIITGFNAVLYTI